MEKTKEDTFEENIAENDSNLVKRAPNKKFDSQYLNRYQKVKNDEIMNPEVDGSQFMNINSYDVFEKGLNKTKKKRRKREEKRNREEARRS